jgi:hypothetical protein
MATTSPTRPTLEIGRIYSVDELARLFSVSSHYLTSAGGIITIQALDSTLLFTHPAGEASFEYGDYWEGDVLMYAGRGQTGHQELKGQNLDVAENRRLLWLFEHAGNLQRRFLGNPTCHMHWWETSNDKTGQARRSLRFALHPGVQLLREPKVAPPQRRQPLRRPRPFDEDRLPSPPTPGVRSTTPEQIAQLQEKANAGHHRLLVGLKRELTRRGWTDIEEIPAAVDLWARRGPKRVLFEAKTIALGQELTQLRSALSQLFEYRFFYGTQEDSLCVVTDVPISESRLRFFGSLSIGALYFDGNALVPCGVRGAEILT